MNRRFFAIISATKSQRFTFGKPLMSDNTEPNHHHKDYAFWVRIAAISSSSVALILIVIKVYAWLVTDSSAMLASTTDSILDLFASLMNVVILRFALAPAEPR